MTEVELMRRALWLAEKNGRYVSPNPKVGAILVKNGRIISEGAHSRYGGPHAEVVALKKAGPKAKGAVLYVTLEPCSHYGKTPPCCVALVQAGVQKVVAAVQDPNPLVAGKGFSFLRRSGIKVRVGLLSKEAKVLNAPFFFSMKKGRPWVTLKAAISLDGKIATVSGKSRWITGEWARKRAHELRAQSDAILVGVETALKDNPSLTVRLPGYRRRDGWPLRVVLDGGLRIGLKVNLFKGTPETVIFTSDGSSAKRQKIVKRAGIKLISITPQNRKIPVQKVLDHLFGMGVRRLLVEGGGRIHASFLEEKLADEAALFIAPKIFGGDAPTWVGGLGIENPNRAPYLKGVSIESLGPDHLWMGRIEY